MSEHRLPAPLPRVHASWHTARWWAVAAGVAALWWWTWGRTPVPLFAPLPVSSATHSPLLRHVHQQGVLRVALRTYPRPSLPNAPLPAEPDVLDMAYAQWLARDVGVPLEISPRPVAHLVLHDHDAVDAAASTPASPAYGEQAVQLLVLRQQLPQWQHWGLPAWRHTLQALLPLWHTPATNAGRAPTVCFGQGVIPAQVLQARGMRPRAARSAIHAISDFLAGQCDVLAESPAVIGKLLQQPTWRFYAPLGAAWSWQATTSPPTDPWLHATHQRWWHSAARQQALHNRTSTVLLEAALLEDGAICH